MKREIVDFFKMNDVKFKENYLLSRISTIRIGKTADFIAYPDSIEKIVKLACFLQKHKIEHKILGRMSNILPSDYKYKGVIVRTDLLSGVEIKGKCVEVGAGISLPNIAMISADAGLSGFEEISGIPGSAGGSIVGNAGAFGREISDIISRVKIFDYETLSVEEYKNEKLEFNYRTSALKNSNKVVLSAEFSLARSDKDKIKKQIQEYRDRRTLTQPVGKPSLGCVFKRVTEEKSAAWYIDKCKLKGYSIGGAKVSEKHAGFIINQGGATAGDYNVLVDYITQCVYNKFGVVLEKEIEIM